MDPSTAKFEFIAGHPALDFVNTVGGKRLVQPKENLCRPEDLVAWGRLSGVFSAEEAQALGQQVAAHPAQAQKALRRAVAFRESLFQLLLASHQGRPAPAAAVASLQDEVQKALAARRLVRTEAGYRWSPPEVVLGDSVVPRLSLAAEALLTGGALSRLRMCEDTNGCGWLFLDTTRNHSRRWCDMASCGNKHKARRHYARVRAPG